MYDIRKYLIYEWNQTLNCRLNVVTAKHTLYQPLRISTSQTRDALTHIALTCGHKLFRDARQNLICMNEPLQTDPCSQWPHRRTASHSKDTRQLNPQERTCQHVYSISESTHKQGSRARSRKSQLNSTQHASLAIRNPPNPRLTIPRTLHCRHERKMERVLLWKSCFEITRP